MSNASKRSYTNEFIEGAIKLALSSVSVASAAKDLGIPLGTLHAWINKAKRSGKVSITADNGVVNNINITEVLNENLELKKRVSRLEQEKAILKKAATYFATELT